ncbi:MAG: FG-GAP repeat protein [Dyadobacter sp.]|uniref:FG-GAP-like repeat-containing protein n=1 Tax=Dyadobacter sp. TaxID=1914288 RepID=UPI001B2E017F|nr:FG-GAP-like repeat-containing protein [Dyadobacter sp.]MBO9616854.1 FG-GAP repeat protein [Dyadobacter sp.]
MKKLYQYLFLPLLAFCIWALQKNDRFFPSGKSSDKFSSQTTTAKNNVLLPDSAAIRNIRNVIASREYHVTYDNQTRSFQSPNRRQNLRATYEPGALTIRKRVDSTHSGFTVKLLNKGVFADDKLLYAVAPQSAVTHSENKVVIDHGHFSEEFINSEEGIRQNFIVEQAPEGVKSLEVKLIVSGATVRDLGQNELHFVTGTGKAGQPEELVYNGLKCWDADGKILDAALAYVNNQIEIKVGVENASFPVTIDPLTNSGPVGANKMLEIHQYYAWMGYSVSTAGDVNGDGYSDVIVGAPKYDNGQADEGAAFVFPGTAAGISLAAKILQSNQVNAQAGTSVSTAGDVNGDGYSDVLVGAPYYDAGQTDEGAVFVYLGSAAGLNTNPAKILEINQTEANFGISVAMAGDVNGDRRSDILVGAHRYDNGQLNEGAAFLYYGNAVSVGAGAVALEANQAGAMMGYSVSSAGDLNGDGYTDVMVGARLYSNGQAYEGAVFIYRGSASGLIKDNPQRLESDQVDARFGHSLAAAGDVNGDHYADIIIGAYLYDGTQENQGAAFLYFGLGVGDQSGRKTMITLNQREAQFGWAVAGAGDVNGDGFADFMIGARYYDNEKNNEGGAFIYYGGLSDDYSWSDVMITGQQQDAWLGSALAPAGDVNGDGYSDLIIGAYTYDNGQTDEGLALIYHGGGLPGNETSGTSLVGSAPSERFGSMVAGAGDINGDGLDDVLISAPGTNPAAAGRTLVAYGSEAGIGNSHIVSKILEFGRAVAGAGDINGDGYADIIIGNPNYTNTGNGGEARIYYGSPTGLDSINYVTLTEPSNGSLFGIAVSGATDLNGDHYADVVIGAPKYKVGNEVRGAAFVYYGSANGLITTPKILLGKSINASMGAAVAGLGDTNGDGFDDLIVGAPTTSIPAVETGAAWVYYGSASGVDNSTTLLKADYGNIHFGTSVAAAGDVNGDGFSDAVVGIPGWEISKSGAIAVYFGQSVGLQETYKQFHYGSLSDTGFGTSVSGAGDLNGDGYSDLIIGSPAYSSMQLQIGRFTIIPGNYPGANGPGTVTGWVAAGAYTMDQMGTSVSCAGDVNGDGFSDIIVGIPGFDTPTAQDVGKVRTYFGGGEYTSGNKQSYPPARQGHLTIYNAGSLTPYAPGLPGQDAQPTFDINLVIKSFLGGTKLKVVWETKNPSQPFSRVPNTSVANSVQFTGSTPDYVDLGNSFGNKNIIASVTKLSGGTKVRARVKYDPVLAITGQMYGPWRYPSTLVSGKSVSPPPQEMVSSLRMAAEMVQKAEESVSIYPNPASERLFIRSNSQNAITGIRLITASGTAIYSAGKAQTEIDLKGIAPGMYVLVTKHADGSELSHKVAIRK